MNDQGGQGILYWIVYFIITLIIVWLAFSVILIWANPALYNTDGSLNWGVSLWISAITVLLAWLFLLLVWWIIKIFTNSGNCGTVCDAKPACAQPCPEVKPPCNPCGDGGVAKSWTIM